MWTESNTPSKTEGAGGADVPKALIYKMTKQVLHGIRVDSKEELKGRIYKYFDEINADPVVYRWGWNLQDVDPNEDVKVQKLIS